MWAIAFNEENLEQVADRTVISETELTALEMFLHKDYIFISGWYGKNNIVLPWAIMPRYAFVKVYDFGHKIDTEWVHAVRP